VRLHGFPECIISDRDTRFTSRFWRALWKLFRYSAGHEHFLSPSDGMDRRRTSNRVVQDILRAFASDDRKDWDRHLTAVEIAINSSRHASTGYTPHFLNHNQEMRLPFGIALKESVALTRVPAAVTVMTEMAANDETARTRLAEAQARQGRSRPTAIVGRRCTQSESRWMLRTKHLSGYKHKLACRFIGPFPIVAVGTATVTFGPAAGHEGP